MKGLWGFALCIAMPVMAVAQVNLPQQTILAAQQAVMKGDYPTALRLYDQAVASDPENIEAYLQRGIIRRETKDESGAANDGAAAVRLADKALAATPNNAVLYHERGMGYRLVRDFPHAREDVEHALQLSGNGAWRTDLQAIALEEKIYQ